MKAMKKLMGAVVAVVCGVSLGMPFSAAAQDLPGELEAADGLAATAYDNCDINQDGTVDILDVIKFNKYLNGYFSYPNYNLLDLNRNQIVDASDALVIMAKVTKNTYSACFIDRPHVGSNAPTTEVEVAFPTYTYAVNNGVSWNTDAIAYWKKNVITGTTKTYWLNPSVTPLQQTSYSTNLDDGIIDGNDTRYSTTLPENCGIVSIQYTDSSAGGVYTGSGFFVAPHIIATAAHVVKGVRNSYPLTITMHNADGTLSNQTLHPVEVHIPYQYLYSDASTVNDYALITVSDDLSNVPYFSIGDCFNLFDNHFDGVPIFVTGNPGKIREGTGQEIDNTDERKLYSESGSVYTNADDANGRNSLFRFTTDISKGDSGGPVYTITKNKTGNNVTYTYTALTTATTTFYVNPYINAGPRFTKYHQMFYNGNSYAIYEDTTK